jgi:hypothetical protein
MGDNLKRYVLKPMPEDTRHASNGVPVQELTGKLGDGRNAVLFRVAARAETLEKYEIVIEVRPKPHEWFIWK